ncbi:LacI family DNA-binding transcriptional regulator [Enterococcus sp. BWR-S5]|uniref:LacI family DNA-binding transcriptional regulator n=1 Tax=Enterococcus sp. BWR-S5 TaxID=2787714 RepID=UPI0019227843|nr:LacI family DNA-binding transcriptional regulator [Enterococcus sp. BWR-S5]MBL1226114.1 LacI family DNA-binding transcriptional regulator [Enterococcus sp. BWR-S5]
MKKVSIKDIAQLSGVSVATVSRVINNNGRFSEETRKKVLDVIKETGYQMNFSAKSLRMKKSFSIGVLVPDISNYFFSDVVQQIEEILFEKDYSTIICNTARNADKEAAYLQMLESKMIDGLIVISGADEFGFDYSKSEKDIPYICIDREPKNSEQTIFISSNHYQGAFEAAEALIHSGSKQPIIAMHKRASSSAKERFKGFKDALKKNNIVFDAKKNQLLLNSDNSYSDTLTAFLNRVPEVDGIFAINDNIAMELLLELRRAGKHIPKDIKVIGFDNTPQTKYSTPSLSSVKQNTQGIANNAVESLLELINHPHSDKKGQSILLPVELILRESINT